LAPPLLERLISHTHRTDICFPGKTPRRTRKAIVEQYERLAAAVAVVIGWEAMIVLHDVCGLDDERERTVVMWMARVLVEAMLAESSVPSNQAGGEDSCR